MLLSLLWNTSLNTERNDNPVVQTLYKEVSFELSNTMKLYSAVDGMTN